jgi:hypothetical protein
VGRSPFLPWVIAAAAVTFGALGLVLNALAGSHGDPGWQSVLAGVVVQRFHGVLTRAGLPPRV